jgi:hypothetical protein
MGAHGDFRQVTRDGLDYALAAYDGALPHPRSLSRRGPVPLGPAGGRPGDRDPLQWGARDAGRGGRLRRPERALRRGAVGGRGRRLQARSADLSAGRRSARGPGRAHLFHLDQCLGRGGGGLLRVPGRLAQPLRPAARTAAGTAGGGDERRAKARPTASGA